MEVGQDPNWGRSAKEKNIYTVGMPVTKVSNEHIYINNDKKSNLMSSSTGIKTRFKI
jgi:hypothetical protein